MNGLTHYYNLVLSRLNREKGVDLTVVVPASAGNNVGQGVYLTKDGADFPIIELQEKKLFVFYSSFKCLSDTILSVKPDVIVVVEPYFYLHGVCLKQEE